MTFLMGDRVRCIVDGSSDRRLKRGQIYTVAHLKHAGGDLLVELASIQATDYFDYWWSASRFELVESAPAGSKWWGVMRSKLAPVLSGVPTIDGVPVNLLDQYGPDLTPVPVAPMVAAIAALHAQHRSDGRPHRFVPAYQLPGEPA